MKSNKTLLMGETNMILETDRLLLKSPDEVTAKAVCDYYIKNRKFLEEFEPARDEEFFTEEHQQKLLNGQMKDWNENRSRCFYITTKENKTDIIGAINLNNIVMGVFCSCFLGYRLDYTHNNMGYMTEATNRIVQFAFEDLKLHRIEGNIIPRNKASIAVVEKCNFEYEGISRKYLKINGVWEDHVHYVKLNEEME